MRPTKVGLSTVLVGLLFGTPWTIHATEVSKIEIRKSEMGFATRSQISLKVERQLEGCQVELLEQNTTIKQKSTTLVSCAELIQEVQKIKAKSRRLEDIRRVCPASFEEVVVGSEVSRYCLRGGETDWPQLRHFNSFLELWTAKELQESF